MSKKSGPAWGTDLMKVQQGQLGKPCLCARGYWLLCCSAPFQRAREQDVVFEMDVRVQVGIQLFDGAGN